MARSVKDRLWSRILLCVGAVVVLCVGAVVVWLATGGWSEVKLSQKVMQFRADPAMDVAWTNDEESAVRQKQMEDQRAELFAALEAVGPDRPSFRWAYRDIIVAVAPELNRMSYFTPAVYATGSDPDNNRRARFFTDLAETLRKHPHPCLPLVMELLHHPDPDVQAVAVGCVWSIPVRPGEAPPKAPDNPDCTEYLKAVEERQTEFVSELIPMLRHPRPEVRVMTAEVMERGFGRLDPRVTLELAIQLRDERHRPLYAAMSRSLDQIPRWWESAEGRQAVSVIAETLTASEKREIAVHHLEPAGADARAAVPQAVLALRGDYRGRLQALRLLLAINSDAKATAEAVPELIQQLSWEPVFQPGTASEHFGFPNPNDERRYARNELRTATLKVLAAIGPEAKAAAPAVKELVKDESLKSAASETLKAIAPE